MLLPSSQAHQQLAKARKHAALLDEVLANAGQRPGIALGLERQLTHLQDFRCVLNSDPEDYHYDPMNARVHLMADSYNEFDFYWECIDAKTDRRVMCGGLNFHGPTRDQVLSSSNPINLIADYHGWSCNT